jgi:hypothetical protein
MRNDSTSLIRRIARLAAPAAFGLAILACGSNPSTVESDAGAVSSPRSADAVERSSLDPSESADRSADAVERDALARTPDSIDPRRLPR